MYRGYGDDHRRSLAEPMVSGPKLWGPCLTGGESAKEFDRLAGLKLPRPQNQKIIRYSACPLLALCVERVTFSYCSVKQKQQLSK
jgi:hypothetical protein